MLRLAAAATLLLMAARLPAAAPAALRAAVKPDYIRKINIPSGVDKMKPPPGIDKPVLMMTNKEKKGGRYDNPMDPPEWLLAKKMQPPGLPLTPPPPAPEMPPGLLTPVAPGGFTYGTTYLGSGQLAGSAFAPGTQESVPAGGFGR
jgi:hypothetical protein